MTVRHWMILHDRVYAHKIDVWAARGRESLITLMVIVWHAVSSCPGHFRAILLVIPLFRVEEAGNGAAGLLVRGVVLFTAWI